jgi:DNA-binding LacI/PurR family transcriptional regulator
MPRKNIIRGVDVLRIACAAVCDRRTVRRYLNGSPVTDSTAARIERALRDLGVEVEPQPRLERTT